MNKAILMGRLTRDPEFRNTQSNTPVCSFTIAVDRRFKNAAGERQADFIPVVCWRQQAEFVNRYFKKGSAIAVVGSIQTRSWADPDGKRHYATEVQADEVYFAESRRSADSPSPSVAPSAPATAPYNPPAGDRFFEALPEDETSLPFDL